MPYKKSSIKSLSYNRWSLWEAFINKKQITMEASGPHGSLLINNMRTSTESINRFNYSMQKVLFVCAGTGIVPCLPVIDYAIAMMSEQP